MSIDTAVPGLEHEQETRKDQGVDFDPVGAVIDGAGMIGRGSNASCANGANAFEGAGSAAADTVDAAQAGAEVAGDAAEGARGVLDVIAGILDGI